MSITLASSTAGRIGQLVRLLGSDKTGEVIAAASAIKRTLHAVGLDIHVLADATEKAFTTQSVSRDDVDIALAIKFCARRSHELTGREFDFIHDMDRLSRRLGSRLELRPKQETWLLAIFDRLRGAR